jgi:hypothetical protein
VNRASWTRRWLSRRALLLHFLLVVEVPLCLLAAWWQANVAMSGNTLSYVYAVEWPGFACVGVYAWWHLLHLSPAAAGAGAAVTAGGGAAGTAGGGQSPHPAPAARRAPIDTATRRAPMDTAASRAPIDTAASRAPMDTAAASGSFEASTRELTWDPAAETPAWRAYNLYLAEMHATGHRQRWRSPTRRSWTSTIRRWPASQGGRPRLGGPR